MNGSRKPVLRRMSAREARALLARLGVGRIAYASHDRVDIEPIHYATDGEWIYGRTSLGAKLFSLVHRPWCAFEADEVFGPFDWASVVVKGAFFLLDPDLSAPEAYERCLAHLRARLPETLTADDPAPQRAILFRIQIQEITGRCAVSSPSTHPARQALLARRRRAADTRTRSLEVGVPRDTIPMTE
jgi:nitroimidazol reductase NimA-like FMN-containing flavoprotein (pyridoxamine 5'-phosphate oxidase superfamily)